MASGLAIPWPAMSGAEPWTGSKRPGAAVAERGAGQHPERARDHRRLVAEDVAEHVLGDDHVEVARRGDELHRGVSTSSVLELDVRVLLRRDAAHDLAPQAAGLEHVGLVDARDLRARGAEGDARDALDLRGGVDARSLALSSVRVFSPK